MDENLRAMLDNLEDLITTMRISMMKFEQTAYALFEEIDYEGVTEDATAMLIDAGKSGLELSQLLASGRAMLSDIAKEVLA